MPSASPPIIGLAGGIGSGKSQVAAILRDLGCFVSDSDAAARAVLRDPAVRDELVSWWGRDVLDEGGEIDRGKVAGIVFNDPPQRTRLEGLTHPWIEDRRRTEFAATGAGVRALVIDAPLLVEAGLDASCDAVIFVDASRETRLARVISSRGWSEEMLLKREESQLPLDEKKSRADYVVSNDGSQTDLIASVRRILNQIAPLAGSDPAS